ncbi:MAG: acyl-CoA reductase [Bacillota bacterium]|nr:acyl-CoA reductase [Bacillota bacterium]
MPIDSNKVEYLCHNGVPFEKMKNVKPLRPFADEVISFLSALSQELFRNKTSKVYPEIVTFAFYCRKANLENERKKYLDCMENHIGRGLTFHIAPSNVPINFAYSMVAGLLSGNACIVRVSSKPFPQTDIICNAMNSVLSSDEHSKMKEFISVIRYERDTEVTSYLSALCNVRIIWGGDETISGIRKSPISPRAYDITFADRYSVCVIKAKEYLVQSNYQKTADAFYNDTYLFDQNACSSPHLIVWVGTDDDIEKAKDIFWDTLYSCVKQNYKVEAATAVDKLMTFCRCAIDIGPVKRERMNDNLVSRISVSRLTSDIHEYRCPGGCFIEYSDVNLDSLAGIVNEKYQTMTYIGFEPEELKNWVMANGLKGIDRIVPVGKSSDFSLIWDGYDLIRNLSRVCYSVQGKPI